MGIDIIISIGVLLFISHVAVLMLGFRMGRTQESGAALMPKTKDTYTESTDFYDEERLDFE